jgi:D-2-hydroxyacid dehydrogenase (NADP+)
MSEAPLAVITTRPLPQLFPRAAFEGRAVFRTAPSSHELRSAVRDADVLYSWEVPDNVPAETPRLRWIQLPSAGADQIAHLPVWASDIVITASKGIHTVPITEHLFAMLLGLTRHIPYLVRAQDRQEWLSHVQAERLHFGEIRGKTMGIVGWGKIGDGIAHAATALGMRVIGTRHSLHTAREVERLGAAYSNPPWLEPEDLPPNIVYPAAQLHEVLGESDVVVLILPLTPQTERSFGREEFRAMRRGSLLFNLGRGPVVDEEAMIQALRSRWLAGAGLDVFETEPLPRSSPLWGMPNVIVSPHLAGTSRHTAERAAELFAVNLSRYLEGQALLNVVDRDQGY